MIAHKFALSETQHSFTSAGHHIHYRTFGTGTPLVLIHGYGVAGSIWQPTLPYFAEHHQVFVIDLPGHGKSKHHGTWQLRALAPLLAELLEQLKLPSVAVMGQSMGGAIAIHLAAYAPALVKQLVLVSAAGVPLKSNVADMMRRSILSSLQSGNGIYPAALLRDLLRLQPMALWQAAGQVTYSDFRAELAAITAPTLILWGERDILIPIELGYALHAALPHATFTTLPSCGHRPMLAEPQKFSQLVLEFLHEIE